MPQPDVPDTFDSGLARRAWRLLLCTSGSAPSAVEPDLEAASWLDWRGDVCLGPSAAAPLAVRPLLDLYGPLCGSGVSTPLVVAHLGQSLDGFIATNTGDSYYVTGPENVKHLHRLRALCAAVVVGAGTIERDDPQLTVRHVEGTNPLRVVLDPQGRLGAGPRVMRDGQAATLVVRGGTRRASASAGSAEILEVRDQSGELDLSGLLRALAARGIRRVFVEGGGDTVSRFLKAGLVDRLQVTVAALVTGRGRRGLDLPARDKLSECLRPAHRVFGMGSDVLFDCDLRASPTVAERRGLSRIS